jgi:hypothetical protein
VVLAFSGFVFILFSRPHFLREMRTASFILIAGLVVYGLRFMLGRNLSGGTTSGVSGDN